MHYLAKNLTAGYSWLELQVEKVSHLFTSPFTYGSEGLLSVGSWTAHPGPRPVGWQRGASLLRRATVGGYWAPHGESARDHPARGSRPRAGSAAGWPCA